MTPVGSIVTHALEREPFSGSDWGERRRAARARAAVAERARAERSAEPPRRRRRAAGGALAVLAVLGVGATAALAMGFTSEPEQEELTKSGLQAGTKQLRRAEQRRVELALTADTVLGVKRNVLESIAECESGGRPDARSSDGTYRGKYQFDKQTWAAMGGKGDPAKASELEQDYRAAELYKAAGSSPWPVCG